MTFSTLGFVVPLVLAAGTTAASSWLRRARDSWHRDRVLEAHTAGEIARYLRALGEPTDAPPRSPPREPPYWASRVLRRRDGDVDAA